MAAKTFTILGATGQIGHVLTEELLKSGHRVKAIGRNGVKLEALKNKGAQIISIDISDVNGLTKAFFGSDAAFVMIPPNFQADDFLGYQDRTGEAIRDAIQRSSVKKVLNLSSTGAQHADKTGPIQGLHRQEQRLNALSDVDVLHFRAAYFMQNIYGSIPEIQKEGTLSSPVKGDLPMWMVSTDDIGRKIADILSSLHFKGRSVFEFAGPAQLTQIAVARILGDAIGRDVKYVQIGYDVAEKAMLDAGLKLSLAKAFVEMQRASNDGLTAFVEAPGPDHRGNITFEEFARTLAKQLKAKAAA